MRYNVNCIRALHFIKQDKQNKLHSPVSDLQISEGFFPFLMSDIGSSLT